MKTDNISIAQLAALMSEGRIPAGAVEIAILPIGGKRSKYIKIEDLDPEDARLVEERESEIFPVDAKRTRLEWVEVKATKKATKKAESVVPDAKPSKATKAKETPKEKPEKAAKPKAEPRQHTGFVSMVREMINDGDKTHSKHTIQQMCDVVLAKFPDKDPRSVKRIGYNLSRLTGRKWKVSAVNTGYLNRIDELLFAGELTTRLIGELVAVEYEKDVDSAKSVVRARMQVLKGMGHKIEVPLEDSETRKTTYLPVNEES